MTRSRAAKRRRISSCRSAARPFQIRIGGSLSPEVRGLIGAEAEGHRSPVRPPGTPGALAGVVAGSGLAEGGRCLALAVLAVRLEPVVARRAGDTAAIELRR